jgi:hypothetical protein
VVKQSSSTIYCWIWHHHGEGISKQERF